MAPNPPIRRMIEINAAVAYVDYEPSRARDVAYGVTRANAGATYVDSGSGVPSGGRGWCLGFSVA